MHKTENEDYSIIVEKYRFSASGSEAKIRINSNDVLEINISGPKETHRKITFYEKRNVLQKETINENKTSFGPRLSAKNTLTNQSYEKEPRNCLGCKTDGQKCCIY